VGKKTSFLNQSVGETIPRNTLRYYTLRRLTRFITSVMIIFLFSLTNASVIKFAFAGTSIQEAFKEMKHKPKEFFDMCQYPVTQYHNLRLETDHRYPIGSDVNILISHLEASFGKSTIPPKQFIDYLYAKKKKVRELNSWFHGYSKECVYSQGYTVKWDVQILADMNSKLTAVNLRPLLQANEFASIHIPFNFDYFTNDKDRYIALWSITGKGISKEKIIQLMKDVGRRYGVLSEPEYYDNGKKIVYNYRTNFTTDIASRILPHEFISVVIWKFNDHNELESLQVN
jgi:hypothetical protein